MICLQKWSLKNRQNSCGRTIHVSNWKASSLSLYCNREFQFHRSNSSLSYHLRMKQQKPDFVARGSEKLHCWKNSTNESWKIWCDHKRNCTLDCTECRPINILTDEGLQGVLHVAARNQSCILPSRIVIDQWRNEGAAGEGGRPRAQPKKGTQKPEIWGKYCVKRVGKKKLFQ